jgi:serine phosphatase RsbU (regulator of sigma subunit)
LALAEHLGAVEVQIETLATQGVLPGQSTDEAVETLTRAVELAESTNYLGSATRAHHNLACILRDAKMDFKSACHHFTRSSELNRKRGSVASELGDLGGMAGVLMDLGELEQAESVFPMAQKIMAEVEDPGPARYEIRINQYRLLRYRGELAEAARLLRECLTETRAQGRVQYVNAADNHLADIVLESFILGDGASMRDLEVAEESLVEAIKISEGGMGTGIWPRCQLSVVRAYQGRSDEAHQLLGDAQEKAALLFIPIEEGWINLTKARIAVVEERWHDAQEAFENASATFARLDMSWWWARMLLEWAGAHAESKAPADLERARALLREALSLYNKLGTPYYAEMVENRLQILKGESFTLALAHQEVAKEMARAGRIQEGLLPEEIPRIPGWQLAVVLDPAQETSGDFYDFIPLPDGRWGIVIADVADKGPGAALYMALSRTLIRTFAVEHPGQPERVISAANNRIMMDTSGGLFITVFYCVLDPGAGTMVYCNAGHNPPYLLGGSRAGEVRSLIRTGVPLGIFEESEWEQGRVDLISGDMLVLYTDGVTEALGESDTFYEEERLIASAVANLGRSAQEVQSAMLEDIHRFVGSAPQFDDLTLMVILREAMD